MARARPLSILVSIPNTGKSRGRNLRSILKAAPSPAPAPFLRIPSADLLLGSNLSVYVIISSYILRGIAYGILLHVNYKILVNLVGVKNSTIVILLEELGINILVIIANAIGGNIIENISYNAYYLILGSMAFLDLIYYLIFVQKYVIKNDKIEVVNV